MGLFKRNRPRRETPAAEAESSKAPSLSGLSASVRARLSGKGKEPAAAPVQAAQPVKPTVPSTPASQTLWDQAYEKVKTKDAKLVEEYEALLSRELSSDCDHAKSDQPQRQAQLDLIIQQGLQRLDNKTTITVAGHEFTARDTIAQATELVLWAKTWIGEAVKASPEASMAWVGVSLVLPLLTNPKTAEEANSSGFTYVTARMRYYTALDPLLLRLGHTSGVSDTLMTEAAGRIVELYQHILDFQIRSVRRFYQKWPGKLARDVLQLDAWTRMVGAIKELEKAVDTAFGQINDLGATMELEALNTNAKEALKAMQQHLDVAMAQLDVAEESRDLQRQLVQHRHDDAKQRLSEQEQKVHQLFRLTKSDKDATYEWYKSRVEDRVEGTCNWFLTHENYLTWLQQNSGPLLVSADPGCGKSVLAKYLIDHALPRSATICYFFFKDQDQNTVRQALCALLHQLFSYRPFLIRHAMSEYAKNGNGLIDTTASLWRILWDASQDSEVRPLVFVLDALDECAPSEFNSLIGELKRHYDRVEECYSGMKWLLTCRPYENIVSGFENLTETFPCIRIPGEQESDAISREVNLVIARRVSQLAKEKRLSEKIKQHLSQKLLAIEHRTYLWIYLVFDYLRTSDFKRTEKGIEYPILNLPGSVNQAYENILNKSKNDPMVRKALNIILAAAEPLTLEEMNVAVSLDATTTCLDDLDLEDEGAFELRLRSWCGLFVSIHHGKLYFLHQTAREFLLADGSASKPNPALHWHRSLDIRQAHTVLAVACVLYIKLVNARPDNMPQSIPSGQRNDLFQDEYTEMLSHYTFLSYSAINWGFHFRQADIANDSATMHLAVSICDMELRKNVPWYAIYRNRRSPMAVETTSSTSLHVASRLGLQQVIEKVFQSSHDVCIDAVDDYGATAMVIAVKAGYDNIVQLLLERGADPDVRDMAGYTMLIYTVRLDDHKALLRTLLENGANIEAKDNRWKQTPLSWAAREGHVDAVQLLLANEADTEAKDKLGQTPLLWAAWKGHVDIARLLLEKEANIEVKDDDHGLSPLSWAADSGHVNLVQLLLNNGADIKTTDKYGRTPLSWAVMSGHVDVARFLLDNGADIETKNEDERTPLLWAAENGDVNVVRFLLEQGADIEAKGPCQRTPLLEAARAEQRETVQLLLEMGANEEASDKDGNGYKFWSVT